MDKICAVKECGPAKKLVKGYCGKHYKRFLKGKLPEINPPKTLADRYWQYVDKSLEDDCWNWTAGKRLSNTTYYGRIKANGKVYSAHRVGYCLANGLDPIEFPSTIPVHHTCGNSLCQNPKHLQATTFAENTAEMLERHNYLKRIAYLESLLDLNNIEYNK